MKKGITLIELLGIIVLILLIFFIVILASGKIDSHCYYTSKGIICTYGELGSDK